MDDVTFGHSGPYSSIAIPGQSLMSVNALLQHFMMIVSVLNHFGYHIVNGTIHTFRQSYTVVVLIGILCL